MKAWVLHGIGDLRLEDVEKPIPEDNEVLIKVKNAGICGSDIPRIYRTGAHKHPLIPGHEFSGIVSETGAKVDTVWQGKRVGVFPLIPCKHCLPCQQKKYEMCRNYSYLGSRTNGAFAEYVSVPIENLIELPEGVSFEEAAMLEPMSVVIHAIRRVSVVSKESVAVCGLGTIGMLLVMFLMESGVKNIYLIGNKDFQKQVVLKMGLPEANYCDNRVCDMEQWLMEQTDGVGVDVFFECVGKNETFAQAVNCTGTAGRICLIGNPCSDMKLDKNVYWKILRNQLIVTGTWNSSFINEMDDDWHYAIDRLLQKKVSPGQLISHRFSLEELETGFYIMKDKLEDYIKIMAVY